MVRGMAPRMIGADSKRSSRGPTDAPELIDPAHVRHIIVSPRQRAQVTSKLLFENNPPSDCSWVTDPEVAEWDYGAYEGMLTKDIRKLHPGWEIWRDGCVWALRDDTDHRCPPGNTPGESPEQMATRVDRVIEKVRAIHQEAAHEAATPEEVDYSDVIIFSHGHFTRSFIARWCQLPLAAGYNFSSDAGGVSTPSERECDGADG